MVNNKFYLRKRPPRRHYRAGFIPRRYPFTFVPAGKFILERRLVREAEVAHNQLAERLFESDGPASPVKVRLNWKRL